MPRGSSSGTVPPPRRNSLSAWRTCLISEPFRAFNRNACSTSLLTTPSYGSSRTTTQTPTQWPPVGDLYTLFQERLDCSGRAGRRRGDRPGGKPPSGRPARIRRCKSSISSTTIAKTATVLVDCTLGTSNHLATRGSLQPVAIIDHHCGGPAARRASPLPIFAPSSRRPRRSWPAICANRESSRGSSWPPPCSTPSAPKRAAARPNTRRSTGRWCCGSRAGPSPA